MRHLILISAFILGFPMFVLAQEPAEAEQTETERVNPVLEAARAIADPLEKPQRRHFNVMYSNYNIIQVVETVQDHVDLAVDACGDANADLKTPLQARFNDWKAAIKPVLKEADANVSNMILAQDYAKPREIRKFFKLVKKTRKDQEKATKKVPVTSPEACQALLEKMDETEENMVKLLRSTLVSLPQAIQAEEEEARRKAAEEQAKKDAEESDEL